MQSASSLSYLLVTVPRFCACSSAVPCIEFHVCSCSWQCIDACSLSWQGSWLALALWWQLDELVLALLLRCGTFMPGFACNGASWLHPASPRTPGPNTLGFAVAACLAPLASTMPTVPLSRAGVAPVGDGVPFHCMYQISVDSTSHTSMFVTMHGCSRQSKSLGLLRKTAGFPLVNTPFDFSRPSAGKMGSFKLSGSL